MFLVATDPVSVFAAVGAEDQVVAHAHAVEDPSPLGDVTDPEPDDLGGGEVGDVLAAQPHLSPRRRRQPGDGSKGRRFPGAVAADEGHDLSLLDVQGHALEGVDPPVVGVDGIDFEECHQAC